MVFVTVYRLPSVPPDTQTVAAVVVLVSESFVIPDETVQLDVEMVSELSQSLQSIL